MAAIHNISDKAPLDFLTQLETWNYQYNEPTDQFFKYVGMGMMVLYSDWKLTFIIKCNNGRLLPHASDYAKDFSLKYSHEAKHHATLKK